MIHVSLSLLIILVGTVRVSPPETLTMVPERLRRACKIKIRAAAIRVDYLRNCYSDACCPDMRLN